MGDFLDSAERLLAILSDDVTVLAAHRIEPPGPPRLSYRDLEDFRTTLLGIRDGSVSGTGVYPVTFEVNERVMLMAEPRPLQRW